MYSKKINSEKSVIYFNEDNYFEICHDTSIFDVLNTVECLVDTLEDYSSSKDVQFTVNRAFLSIRDTLNHIYRNRLLANYTKVSFTNFSSDIYNTFYTILNARNLTVTLKK